MQPSSRSGLAFARPWVCLLIAGCFVAGPIGAAAAAEGSASGASPTAAAAQLIPQLGSGLFAAREAATNQLAKMGIEIKPALLAAMDDSDAEVRERVRWVLASVVDTDFQHRLVQFAEDTNDAKHYELPGWARFRELVGSDRAARNLFIEMQRSEMTLMEGLEVGREAATRILESRICAAELTLPTRGLTQPGTLSLGTVAALLFIGSDKSVNLSENYAMQLGNLAYQQSFQQAVIAGQQSAMLKRILGAWIARDLSPTLSYQNLYLALRFELKECLEPAIRLLKQPGASPQMKPLALLALARFGGKEHLPLVEPLLGATDVCGQTNVNGTLFATQLRDVALYAAVRLVRQSPKDFGFTRFSASDQLLSQAAGIGFRNNVEREEAFKKWNDWRAANLPPSDEKRAAPAKS